MNVTKSINASSKRAARPASELALLQRLFAGAVQSWMEAKEKPRSVGEPALQDFLPELLQLYAMLGDDGAADVNVAVHDRLFIYSENKEAFREAPASQLIHECRTLRRVFVPLVSRGDAGGDPSLAHDIIDACMTYVADAFIHEEELLRQSRAQFAEVIDTIPQLVWRTTVDGEATFANRPFLEYVGCLREEVLGWGWTAYIHPEDRARVIEEWSRCRKAEAPVKVAFRVRGASGYRWFLSLGNPYRDGRGNMVAYYGTWTDIHDYKAIEARLQQAIHSRDEFLSIASHELKTPLTAFKLQVEMHDRALKRGDPEAVSAARVQRMLAAHQHHIARITRLVEDMLDVARIESGHLQLIKKSFDIGGFLREVVDRMGAVIDAAQCSVDLQVETGIQGFWDPIRMEQVLGNLLGNACRYAPGSQIRIYMRLAGEQVILEVSDNGPGVSSENQQRIFSRFERAISANECSGLGLGLYVVQQIVTMHGGTIALRSELGQGCEFTLKIPQGGTHAGGMRPEHGS